jgi:hypothetical protein
MTTDRDFDRIAGAWLDLMPSEAPDRAIEAVLRAVERTGQVRRRGFRLRWRPKMNRLIIVTATVAALVAAIGGAMLLSSGRGPTFPTATPAVATSGPSPSVAVPSTPEALRSLWVASAPAGSVGTVLRLQIDAEVITVMDGGTQPVLARAVSGTVGEFVFEASDSTPGCQLGAVGRYSYAFAQAADDPDAGDMQLGLTATEDACAARKAMLERTWTRAFTNGFKGGRGVAIDFDPMFMVTLPEGEYGVTVAGKDALMVEPPRDGAAPGMLVATRNPAGYSDPCSETGGSKIPLAHTVDAFAEYIDSLPGFSVERNDVEIDGLPAVHLTVPTTITQDCPRADHRMIEWSTSDPTFQIHWILRQGDTDSIYLVEVGADLYLLQWLNPTNDAVAEMRVLSTLEFIDTLPG